MVASAAIYGRHTIHCIAMIYAVVSMYQPLAHNRSRFNLLGQGGFNDPLLLERYTLDKHVTSCFPPTFLLHGQSDTAVSVKNTLSFARALSAANITFEARYPLKGRHGFGMVKNRLKGELVKWPQQLLRWLKGVMKE